MRWSEAVYLSQFVLSHALRQASASLILDVRQKNPMKTKSTLTILAMLTQSAQSAPEMWSQNGHYYELQILAPVTWTQAKEIAEAKGGYLATITSAEENEFVQSIIGSDNALVGGFQVNGAVEPNSGWAWITGEPFEYTNWMPNEPDDNRHVGYGNENVLLIRGGQWGDTSGFHPLIDRFIIEYNSRSDFVRTSSLGNFEYTGQSGQAALLGLSLRDDTQGLQFTFATVAPGARCIISWSESLSRWNPMTSFVATAKGTSVSDAFNAPVIFYRATYLPIGVDAAESFDYPVGSALVNEQITPERNSLYPNGPGENVERPLPSQVIDPGEWRNAQDTGSYLLTSKGPAYHPGEDWNLGSGPNDIGENVRAIANGVVMDISPLNNNSNGGWAMVIRHWLLNGDSVDSLYLHVAPPVLADLSSHNQMGEMGEEGWFPFQQGMPVSKGDVIGVIGNVDASIYLPHLHFEIRTVLLPNLPLTAGSAAISHYWPNSLGNAYYGDFQAMKLDGVVDPSDFIDDHK